jgi:prophage regulatory protein
MSQKIKQRLTEAGPRRGGGVRILRAPQVADRTGLSIPTIYRKMDEGKFPRPVPLSQQAVGWIESEIDAWLEELVAARDSVPAA